MNRAVDLVEGRAYVVTDLHGEWGAYVRYRDHFLDLLERGDADILIFLGDLIHGYGSEAADSSLAMLWDVMELQENLGSDRVIMLLGNHELPHIYGVSLSKGDQSFTPRFEHALGEYRDTLLQFLKALPFLVRTKAGIMLTHAGASTRTASEKSAEMLLAFSHEEFLAEVDLLLARNDVMEFISQQLEMSEEEYNRKSWELLAVSSENDPRYLDLLRGFIATSLEPEWPTLWDFFFTQCEQARENTPYPTILGRFLSSYSDQNQIQSVLVTGHIQVGGGVSVIAQQQVRLASWSHAIPRTAASYLLFDTARPLASAHDLLKCVYPMP